MKEFYASIHYDEGTVKLLCNVVCNTYGRKFPIIIGTLSISLIVAGICVGLHKPVGLLSAAFGCILLGNFDYHRRTFTKKMLAVVRDWWPTIHYSFSNNELVADSGKEVTRTPYKSIIRLTRSKEYDYLFVSETTVFMVDMHTFEKEERDAFESFLVAQTGLAFKDYPTFRIRFF